MKTQLKPLLALLSLFLLGYYNFAEGSSAEITKEDGDRLHAAQKIAAEIQQAHKIKCHPFIQRDGNIARLEMDVEDPKFDHKSVAAEITKLKSVRSFQGSLHLVFSHRGNQSDSAPRTVSIKYDAKTGKQL